MLHSPPVHTNTTATTPNRKHVSDMLTPDRLLVDLALGGSGGGYVALVGNHLEGISCGISLRKCMVLLIFIRTVCLQDAAVVKVFDRFVVVWEVYKLVN